MQPSAIFGPFLAMILLTFVVWTYMYVRRITFLQTQGIPTQDLAKPGELARLSPADVSNPSDNLKNLFEMPVLFYALCLYLYVTAEVDPTYVAAAWVFVAFRAAHSVVHCTFNRVMLRFSLYAISAVAVWFIGIRAGIVYFAG